MSSLRAGVLFDVDGTLVDSNYLHTLAWARALRAAGEWAPMHAIHRLVGMGGDNLVPELLGHDAPEAHRLRAAHYRELAPEVRAFPGAARLVRAVRARGLVPVLATSSPRDELRPSLDRLGVDDAVVAVTTADDVRSSKPAPDVFLVAMRVAALEPTATLAVGDSVWDVRAAQAAGIGCVGVESGGTGRAELEEAGALCVYRDVADLADRLGSSPLADLCPG